MASELEILRCAFKSWEWEERNGEIYGLLKPEGKSIEVSSRLALQRVGLLPAWHATLSCGTVSSLGIHESAEGALRRAIWSCPGNCYWLIAKNK